MHGDQALTEQEQSLLDCFKQLSKDDRHSLLRFAEFLVAGSAIEFTSSGQEQAVNTGDRKQAESASTDKSKAVADAIAQPIEIERPDEERVVDALKRLSATYPMLDKKGLLDKASSLVAQHVMFGKPAVVVINEIEVMFSEAYTVYVDEKRQK